MSPLSNGLIWVSDMSELEKFSIPQLICHLQTEFRAGVYNKVEQILTSRDEVWKQKQYTWNKNEKMWKQKEQMWNKSEQVWKQKEENWKQYREKREEMWKGKKEMWKQRVVKLEEETSALVVLAEELQVGNLDVGGGSLLSRQTKEKKGVCDFAGIGGAQIEGPPIVNSPCTPLADHNEERERSSSPGLLSGNPTFENVIEISDSEDENENPKETFLNDIVTKTGSSQKAKKKMNSCGYEYSPVSKLKHIIGSDSEDDDKCINGPDGSDIEAIEPVKTKDDISMFEDVESGTLLRACSSQKGDKNNSSIEKSLSPSTIKRKRSLKLGSSDNEDDYIPANDLSCSNSEKCTSFSTPKTRKRTLRLVCSDSEDDDLCANYPDGSTKKAMDPQKSNENLTNVLSSIRKWKSTSYLKWQFEIDMVSSFETDPILCMKAVCALYRHHIFQEKAVVGSSYSNSSGVCRNYGERGTALAKFLLDGNQDGEVKKSVKDLEAYDSKGLEDCQRVAKYYSDRLFTMYQNKEDSFFP